MSTPLLESISKPFLVDFGYGFLLILACFCSALFVLTSFVFPLLCFLGVVFSFVFLSVSGHPKQIKTKQNNATQSEAVQQSGKHQAEQRTAKQGIDKHGKPKQSKAQHGTAQQSKATRCQAKHTYVKISLGLHFGTILESVWGRFCHQLGMFLKCSVWPYGFGVNSGTSLACF